MIYFYDTEFIEDGKTIDLISIGIVAEDGREYYAISREFDPSRASEWVIANVLRKLPPRSYGAWRTRGEMRNDILAFIGDDKPEFWAFYADYDHVALCQLFGTMMDLPKGWPMYTLDIKQVLEIKGIHEDDLGISNGSEHSALHDARWVRDVFRLINKK
jgi:inhibitor of KinA sporulation pathway (predicted exonuclease)